MTSNSHIKAGSGAECSEVRTRDTVEAIVADMRLIAAGMGGRTGEGLVALADRLQSAHDAETLADLRKATLLAESLGAELEDARKLLAATSEERDHANRAAESAESRLREAERDARRYRWLRSKALDTNVTAPCVMLVNQSCEPAVQGRGWQSALRDDKADAAIDRAMEGEDG